jgi:predicted PurR-regulated permease PerM
MRIERLIFAITAITFIYIVVIIVRIEKNGRNATQNLVNALLENNESLKKLTEIQQNRIKVLESMLETENETITLLRKNENKTENNGAQNNAT